MPESNSTNRHSRRKRSTTPLVVILPLALLTFVGILVRVSKDSAQLRQYFVSGDSGIQTQIQQYDNHQSSDPDSLFNQTVHGSTLPSSKELAERASLYQHYYETSAANADKVLGIPPAKVTTASVSRAIKNRSSSTTRSQDLRFNAAEIQRQKALSLLPPPTAVDINDNSSMNDSRRNGPLEEGLIERLVDATIKAYSDCANKKSALRVLHEAGQGHMTISGNSTSHDDLSSMIIPSVPGVEEGRMRDVCLQLPSDETIADLYGSEPVIYGMESCSAYRDRLDHDGAGEAAIRIASLFNCGSNAYGFCLRDNLQSNMSLTSSDKVDYNFRVPWGKHVPATQRKVNRLAEFKHVTEDHVLPIVIVRDPFMWMQSMCRQKYRATFYTSCPTLVLGDNSNTPYRSMKRAALFGGGIPTTNQVRIKHPGLVEERDSLADWWSEWYHDYFYADFPRLIIRYEDALLHGPAIMKQIAECSGLPLREPYLYLMGQAKIHGSRSTMVSSLAKLSNAKHTRKHSLNEADLEYAKDHLHPDLMKAFKYQY